MALIRIRETGTDGRATVSLDDHGDYPIVVADPFDADDEAEKRLEWYFEEHLRFPFTDRVLAREAADSIKPYGETLFGQVFADKQAYAAYAGARQAGLETLRFEIIGSPEFHALHWEALKDPGLPKPFCLYSPIVRRSKVPPTLPAMAGRSPTINLLIVTARPSLEKDVGYRTIAGPLVESLRGATLAVDLDIVRPGTYGALKRHLERITAERGAGYYHAIHFDLHGGLLKYEDFRKGGESDRLMFRARYGRPDIASYDGRKAFLFFEDEEKAGRADPAEASEVADLLLAHGIPIVILNACQSGKQTGASEASLAGRLMQAGAQTVLGMGYSVTVTAARLMMPALYRELFGGRTLDQAIRGARAELDADKARRAYFQQMIQLEDWLLPVVYQNRAVSLDLAPFSPEQRQAWLESRRVRYRPPRLAYGFFGRDVDILRIERNLLTRGNVLLLRGMGGSGKTTLLHHLAMWWQTTGFIDRVFYFGYDAQAWTRQQIMHAIAGKPGELFDPGRFHGGFLPLNEELQQQDLAEALNGARHLLILDNLESITGSALAIRNTLPADEQNKLKSFLAELAGGQTLVLLGSRSSEAWLAAETFGDNVYELAGLDGEAAADLAQRILEKHKATRWREDTKFQELMRLLDGYPLALEVVLPNLARQDPADVLRALQTGAEGVDLARESKTESILRCIDYSHGNLSSEAQSLLACLAPFTGIVHTFWLETYTERLKAQPALKDLPFDRWPDVLDEAKNWGLLSPHDLPDVLRLQPVFPYFLQTRLSDPALTAERTGIKTAFRELYDQVGSAIGDMLQAKDPEQRKVAPVFAELEYANLATALRLAIEQQASILQIYMALSRYLDTRQDHARGLELGEIVLQGLENYPPEKRRGELGIELVSTVHDIAMRYLLLKRLKEAGETYQKALDLHSALEGIADDFKARGKVSIYHQLGRVAQEQRRWAEAEDYYQQALAISVEFNVRYEQASIYKHLGTVAGEQRRWAEAEGYYQQALAIFVEFNDRYEQARIYHGLGRVAGEQRRWAEAEGYYQQALAIFVEFNDRYEQARIYHELGRVAQEQRRWAEAEGYYQQALAIFVEFNARFEQAATYHGLGRAAQEQRRWAEAEGYYQQALAIFVEFNARFEQAATYHQLGRVAQEQRRWVEALEYFMKDLEISVEFGDEPRTGATLRSLARLWQESGDDQLPGRVGTVLELGQEETEKLLRSVLNGGGQGNDA